MMSGELPAECSAVLANHPDLETLAAKFGFHFECFPSGSSADAKQRHFAWLANRLAQLKPDVIVLARYMQILPEDIIHQFENRIINIHPSLLPHFPGANPYRQAFESGVRVTGCTAHFVTKDLDQGPIILQDVFHIQVGKDTAADVRERGLNAEANILCRALEYFLNEEILVANGQVVFKPGISSFADPLR
jgi:formyltetrahydrofolate deformylase